MNAAGSGHDLPLDPRVQVMEICDRFEAAWQGGRAPTVEVSLEEEGLVEVNGSFRRRLLEGLIGLEVDYRRLRGESPAPEEFHCRFPNDGVAVEAAFADSTETFHWAKVVDPLDGQDGAVSTGSTVPDPDSNRYLMIRELGRGSFGKVCLMRDLKLGRDVAVKTLRSRSGSGSDLEKEARFLSGLDHENVVKVWDLQEKSGDLCIFMQYMEGGSLGDLIKSKPLACEEAVRYAMDVACGLSYLHHIKGKGHYDIKPWNILREGNRDGKKDRAVIADFGLAVREAELTLGRIGTRPYMAPEAIDCVPKLESDVYSLTATLYHLVTGVVPFSASSWDRLKREIRKGLPTTDERCVRAQIPQSLMRLIRLGLEYDYNARIKLGELESRLRDLHREIVDRGAPRFITVGPGGFDPNGVPALLVRLAVDAARKCLQDEAIIDRLGIDRDLFDQILREWPVSLRKEGLEGLCKAVDLLPRQSNAFETFFFGWHPDLTGLALRLSILKSSGHEGSKWLIAGLEAALSGPRMASEWRTIIAPRLARIADDELHKQTQEEIYGISNRLWTPAENDQLIVFDFRTRLWQSIVAPSQNTLDDSAFNHVHYANVVLAERLVRHLARDRDQKATLTLLEGGVGGANTTREVLSRVDAAWGGRRPLLSILFKGYELHPGFTYYANAMLRGRAPSVPNTPDHVTAADPRVLTFGALRGRLRPLDGGPFIEERNMFDGIRDLERMGCYNGRVDAFVCSFAFHHVPNNRRLRQYLTHGFPNEPADKREAFRHDIMNGLRWLNEQAEPRATRTREAAVTLSLTQRGLFDNDLASFESDFRRGWDLKKGLVVPDWFESLEDRQRMILVAIRKLLRPGGLVAIADPDGFSDFNRRQLAKNPEMGIAYFLTRDQMVDLLTSLSFEILDSPLTLIERRGKGIGNRFEASASVRSTARYDSDIIDDNRGYVIVARNKP